VINSESGSYKSSTSAEISSRRPTYVHKRRAIRAPPEVDVAVGGADRSVVEVCLQPRRRVREELESLGHLLAEQREVYADVRDRFDGAGRP